MVTRLLQPLRVLLGPLHAEARLLEHKEGKYGRTVLRGAEGGAARLCRAAPPEGSHCAREMVGAGREMARLVEKRRWRNHAVLGAHELRFRVGLAQGPLHLPKLSCLHQVALVEQQHVGELKLVAEQVRDGALVALACLPAAVDELVHGGQLLKD